MHFSVLVPVQVPVIPDEAIKRAEAANSYIAAIQQQQDEQNQQQDAIDTKNFLTRYNLQYALAVSTPFSAAVDDAVSEVMAPYSQDASDPRFLEFDDQTEYLMNRFETETLDAISFNGKLYSLHHFPNFRRCKDGIIREVTADGQEFLSAKAKQMMVVTVTAKEFYGTFRKYAKEHSDYCKEKKAWGSYYNPNCFWDWYSIGGRWNYALLVREDCQETADGISGAGDTNDAPPAPKGFKWTSAARKKDICIEEMTKISIERTKEQYQKLSDMWSGAIPLDNHLSIKGDGIYSWGRRVFDPSKSISDVLAEHNYTKETAVTRIFHAYLDTVNTKPGDGENGYYDCDCCDDWESQIADFWADLEDNDIIVTVDCHM